MIIYVNGFIPAGSTPIAGAVCRSSWQCADACRSSIRKLRSLGRGENPPFHPATFNNRNGDAQTCPTLVFDADSDTRNRGAQSDIEGHWYREFPADSRRGRKIQFIHSTESLGPEFYWRLWPIWKSLWLFGSGKLASVEIFGGDQICDCRECCFE